MFLSCTFAQIIETRPATAAVGFATVSVITATDLGDAESTEGA